MSRSATKSSADKQNVLSSAQVTPSPTPELNYIIPGRLTRDQWMNMLTSEEADEIVGETMDELLSRVMEGCLNVYIKRQIVPFSISWAKSYITQILEQQILCPDVGDEPEEASKIEDSEPLPAIPDSWAQLSTTPLQQEAGISHISAQEKPVVDQQQILCPDEGDEPEEASQMEDSKPLSAIPDSWAQLTTTPLQQQEAGIGHISVQEEPMFDQQRIPRPPPTPFQKKKQQVNANLKPVSGKLLPSLSTSAIKRDVELKRKNMADFYRTKPIPKIDPATLPRHCVVPQYEIVDNCPQLKKLSGLSKLQPKYNKQQTKWKATSLKPLSSSKDQSAGFQRRHETDVFLKKLSPSTQRKEGMVYSGALRLDKMVLAKGVTLLDPEAAEMNPLIFNPIVQSTTLKPIPSDVAVPLISADQLIAGPPPKVIPLFESSN